MLHTELPIYKKGCELVSLAFHVQTQMRREFKRSLGEKITGHCTEMVNLMALANATRGHQPAASFIDFDSGRWSPVHKPGRSLATLQRIADGRRRFGPRFLAPFYGSGSGTTGRSLDRPIGTITTRDRWAVIDGDRMRMLLPTEARDAMGLRKSYILPDDPKEAIFMLGNAVAPRQARDYLEAVKESI